MDKLDRKTLKILQNNGRKSNADLARELNVAPSTMLERTRRLEERGVIKGYSAEVSPEALGLGVQAYISVSLQHHDVDAIKKFELDIQEVENVRACYHVTGRFDYMLYVAANDLNHLGELIKTKIASITGIGKAETFLVLSEIKPDKGWPILEDESI